MKVENVVVGAIQENCYIVSCGQDCLVIDPGDEYERIEKALEDRNVLAILLTHRHFDHIGALAELEKKTSAPIYEWENLEEKQYEIGPFSFEVLFTPGHTKDSVTYYFKDHKVMFTGDFLFCESIGRTDFEGGSTEEMRASLKRIAAYDDDIAIYPGHEEASTLGHEKQYNPFL